MWSTLHELASRKDSADRSKIKDLRAGNFQARPKSALKSRRNNSVFPNLPGADPPHWNATTPAVQPFLDVRISVLKKTLGRSFRRLYPAFQADIDQHTVHVAVWWTPRLCMLSQTAGSELSSG
jgi:hypothetical protein